VVPVRTFPAVEGLRGILAIAVVVYHAGINAGFTWGIDRHHHGLGGFLRHADVAVPVFFMISAFLLYRPFALAHLRAGPRPDLRGYLLRRLVRLFPAYWLALGVSMGLFGYAADLSWWGKLRLALLVQVYWADTATAGLAQVWSLNTELAFYLVLPGLAALVARRGRNRAGAVRAEYALCAALGLSGLAFRVAMFAGGPHRAQFWLPANLDVFAVGMALAVTSAASIARGGSGREPVGVLRLPAEVPAVALAVVAACFTFLVAADLPLQTPTDGGQELTKRLVFVVLGACLLVPATFGREGRGGYRRLLVWPPLAWVGTVSLGVYLWHITVLDRLDRRFRPADVGVYWRDGGPFLVVAGLALSILAGTVSWLVVERPLQRLARRAGGPTTGRRAGAH